ncbi:MAG TPA: hypothetical protein VN677_11295, partial [Gemmatimonadaceae bacterium]|nr:hypothetical protein [Gemmatimonadaceae bacterium]
MPQTVADLVLGTSVDPSGITAGLQSVSAQIERTLAKSATVQTGANLADSIISGLAGRFSQEQEELAEQVAKGIISPGAFATASAVAVDEFKHGLSAGLGQLAVGGQMTDSIREQFEAAYGAAGAAAGEAFTRSLHAVTGQTSTLISGLQIPTLKADATQALVAEERAFQAALLAGNLDLEQRIRVTQELTRVQDALAASTRD